MRRLSELPVEQREAIVLKIWHEYTFEEIGELLLDLNSSGQTLILVTHNPDLAARYARRVIEIVDGRVASDAAHSERPIATASVSMWAASETSASESAIRPTTISTTMRPRIRPSAIASLRRSASAETAWGWPPWPC